MRLLTRSDFDGLICAVLLKEAGIMDEWQFVHPKDVQDGKVEVTANDILANVPYVDGVGLWFDHHSSEEERLGFDFEFQGASKPYKSAARVVWEYYGGHDTFPESFDVMMDYVDKCDSADLTLEEIADPQGWVMLSFVMDPRTGLGRYKDYRISNYQLMMEMVDACRTMDVEDILQLPDVVERVKRYMEQQESFKDMLGRTSTQFDNVILTDLRNEPEIFTGNRFIVYTMFPECNISMQIMWGLKKQNVVFTVGHSIVNKTSKTDVGSLLLRYGGGGHHKVGTCQVSVFRAEQVRWDLLSRMRKDG